MQFDYYYGNQAEQFTFYRIPKVLFTDSQLRQLSAEAKILYGLLLDRMSLSLRSGWLDEEGRVFIIFTVEDMMEQLGCASQKAARLLVELEQEAGLIERKRQGLGRPNIIYVKNFITASGAAAENPPESKIKNFENQNSGSLKIENQEVRKSKTNNTEFNNTDLKDIDIHPIPPTPLQERLRDKKGRDGILLYHQLKEELEVQLDMEALRQQYPRDSETVEEIFSIILDVMVSSRPVIRISGEEKPAALVKDVFHRLNFTHMEYVLNCLNENTTQVRNIRQYLLAALYNAPSTISNYYNSRVNHDLHGRGR